MLRGARFVIKLLARLAMLVGVVVLLATLAPPRWYIAWLAGAWTDPKGNVLVVLGGDGVDENMLGQTSYARSVYAVWAWREGGFQQVLLSGPKSVTDPMKDFLVSQGVPAGALVLEQRSQNTHENALFRAPLANALPGPYVLLTSDYHMWRAHRAFEKAGLHVEPRPLPDAGKRIVSWRGRWPVFLDLLAESAKIVYYKVRGWI